MRPILTPEDQHQKMTGCKPQKPVEKTHEEDQLDLEDYLEKVMPEKGRRGPDPLRDEFGVDYRSSFNAYDPMKKQGDL